MRRFFRKRCATTPPERHVENAFDKADPRNSGLAEIDWERSNLCGADLRGADVDGVDFYLVDLRGAPYTAEQESHFRKCGAILESRVRPG